MSLQCKKLQMGWSFQGGVVLGRTSPIIAQSGRLDMENITRIDMHQIPQGIVVHKFPHYWTAATPPASTTTNEAMTLDQMTAWLEENGWTVRRWPGGARAWKGEMMPVRTASQIRRKREELRQRWQDWNRQGVQVHALDLAYDF